MTPCRAACAPPARLQVSGAAQPQGSSARDLLQPAFALVAAEAAWRCSNPARYVSPETISAVVTAGGPGRGWGRGSTGGGWGGGGGV